MIYCETCRQPLDLDLGIPLEMLILFHALIGHRVEAKMDPDEGFCKCSNTRRLLILWRGVVCAECYLPLEKPSANSHTYYLPRA